MLNGIRDRQFGQASKKWDLVESFSLSKSELPSSEIGVHTLVRMWPNPRTKTSSLQIHQSIIPQEIVKCEIVFWGEITYAIYFSICENTMVRKLYQR